MTGGGSSIPEVERLLATLAVGRRCAEAGTAFGEGATAIASTSASLVRVESDPERAALARARLHGAENVELAVGDWQEELPPRGPFELLFLDGGNYKHEADVVGPIALDLLGPRGLLVIDDLTPGLVGHDPARAFLLDHTDLVATEILTTPASAAIVAARRG